MQMRADLTVVGRGLAPGAPSAGAWVQCSGDGCPLPQGTLIDVRHFNGDVTPRVRVGEFTVDPDGSMVSRDRGRWSGWDHSDGGPMAPKFRAYRVCVEGGVREREAVFRSWLDAAQLAGAG